MSAAIDIGTNVLTVIGAIYLLLLVRVWRQDRAARLSAQVDEWQLRVAAMKRLEDIEANKPHPNLW